MSDYEYEVGKEYRTRGGDVCVLLLDDDAIGRVWKVLKSDKRWAPAIEQWSSELDKPVPPERTVDQRCYVGKRAVYYGTIASKSSLVRWTIGSDGRPAYAVRLDENGDPMYRVEPVAKGGGDD